MEERLLFDRVQIQGARAAVNERIIFTAAVFAHAAIAAPPFRHHAPARAKGAAYPSSGERLVKGSLLQFTRGRAGREDIPAQTAGCRAGPGQDQETPAGHHGLFVAACHDARIIAPGPRWRNLETRNSWLTMSNNMTQAGHSLGNANDSDPPIASSPERTFRPEPGLPAYARAPPRESSLQNGWNHCGNIQLSTSNFQCWMLNVERWKFPGLHYAGKQATVIPGPDAVGRKSRSSLPGFPIPRTDRE